MLRNKWIARLPKQKLILCNCNFDVYRHYPGPGQNPANFLNSAWQKPSRPPLWSGNLTHVSSIRLLDPIYVNFKLPQQDPPKLTPGASVQVMADTAPGRTFTARISAMESGIDSETLNVPIQALLPYADLSRKSGMYATARLSPSATSDAIVLDPDFCFWR